MQICWIKCIICHSFIYFWGYVEYIFLLSRHEICISGKRYDRSPPEHWIIFPQGISYYRLMDSEATCNICYYCSRGKYTNVSLKCWFVRDLWYLSCLFGNELLSKQMLVHCYSDSWDKSWDFWEQISMKFESECYNCHTRKCIWKSWSAKQLPFFLSHYKLVVGIEDRVNYASHQLPQCWLFEG